MAKNLAIIPIRMGSKRLPRKNVRDFFGKPIFLYTLEAARNSGLFSEILVSTESEEVRDICRTNGLDLPFMRPDELANDKAQLVQVIEHVLGEYDKIGLYFDNFCILWATAPLRSNEDIQKGYSMLDVDADAVVGVTDYNLPVFCAQSMDDFGGLCPIFPDMLRLPSAKMPNAVCDNGSFCWVKVDSFKRHNTWLPPKIKGYWMPKNRSVDIDTEEDWKLAEYYYNSAKIKD